MGHTRQSEPFIPKVVSYDVYDEKSGKYVVEDHYGHIGPNGTKAVASDGYRNWYKGIRPREARPDNVAYRTTTPDPGKAAEARKLRDAAIARKLREQAEWLKYHG